MTLLGAEQILAFTFAALLPLSGVATILAVICDAFRHRVRP
jgi:hypothetical protein